MITKVTEENFQSEVLESTVPVILEFYSDSCIPCKALAPVLADIDENYEGKVKVAKVNVKFDKELAEKHEVLASPTIVFYENGKETARLQGRQKKEQILEKLGL